MVRNVHFRELPATLDQVGALLDSLASENDRLWPKETWPPMILDRPLGVGATGGHRPIRYVVEAYEPGRYVRFRFLFPPGFDGTHAFDVEGVRPGTVRLRHTIEMRLSGPARLYWPLAVRWLHDTLMEDLLDGAAARVAHQPFRQRPWSPWVRLLRNLFLGRQASGQ